MTHVRKHSSDELLETRSSTSQGSSFVLGFWAVRYQVTDVGRAVSFYTQQLGFKLDRQVLPAFALVSINNIKLMRYLSNHAIVRSCRSTRFLGFTDMWPSPGYTTSCVGTPSERSACRNS